MNSRQAGWMPLRHFYAFQVKFSEKHDGLGCSQAAESWGDWPGCLHVDILAMGVSTQVDILGTRALDELRAGCHVSCSRRLARRKEPIDFSQLQ